MSYSLDYEYTSAGYQLRNPDNRAIVYTIVYDNEAQDRKPWRLQSCAEFGGGTKGFRQLEAAKYAALSDFIERTAA